MKGNRSSQQKNSWVALWFDYYCQHLRRSSQGPTLLDIFSQLNSASAHLPPSKLTIDYWELYMVMISKWTGLAAKHKQAHDTGCDMKELPSNM